MLGTKPGGFAAGRRALGALDGRCRLLTCGVILGMPVTEFQANANVYIAGDGVSRRRGAFAGMAVYGAQFCVQLYFEVLQMKSAPFFAVKSACSAMRKCASGGGKKPQVKHAGGEEMHARSSRYNAFVAHTYVAWSGQRIPGV